ncbi:hypothetical protein KAU43_05560, partial [candidate division WOR-3 bacterium]|nr:hypothetical protein [candidate division WOR-3 bacterium]
YKFDNNGNLLDSLNLPMDLDYGNIDFAFGNVYVSSSNKVLMINNTIIDTFCESNTINYDAISMGNNGELAVLTSGDVVLYSSDGTMKSSGWLDIDSKDLLYKGIDILIPGWNPCKVKREWSYGYVYNYREYGVDKGLIKFDPQEFLPSNYTFVNYYPDDDQNGGNITYNGVYDNGNKVSLQSLLGLHYIPTVHIEMFGDWHNSPVFRKLDFAVRELCQDSLIYRTTHSINPAVGENIQFNDTLTDSLSQGEYAIFGNLYTNNNQIVNSNINYFSVIGNEVALLMHRDTNDVPAGWIFHPNIKVINPLPAGQENLHLIVNSNDSLYIDTIFDVDSCSTDSFPISVSPNVPTILNGELILPTGDTLRKEISLNVLAGEITIDVVTPEYVNFEPFEVKNIISNNSGIHQEIIIKRRINTDSLIDTVLIYPNDKNRLYDTLSTINSDTLYVTVSGDFGEIEKKLPI